jgi:tetratricopeptide (TPR) repeat protein
MRHVAPETGSQLAPRAGRNEAGSADRLDLAPGRRRLWWIGGGIASVTIAAVIAAILIPGPAASPAQRSDASGAAPTAASAHGPRRDPAPPVDRAAADLRDRVRIARDAAAAAAAAAANAPLAVERRPTASARETDAPAASERPIARRPGSHRVIVDYSSRPSDPPPPSLVAQEEEDPAIGQARGAYTTGNQRLFAGDLDGAIRAYRQALELYPGYVGGYRGLGLAYEQRGNKADALVALRAYLAAVPNARDAALIKKRIAHLQRP